MIRIKLIGEFYCQLGSTFVWLKSPDLLKFFTNFTNYPSRMVMPPLGLLYYSLTNDQLVENQLFETGN
uniref:Uncharacterized protein n=1 Tax=Cucumis melo TaxID=3656 RepID=A0A9I9EK53_CUCME